MVNCRELLHDVNAIVDPVPDQRTNIMLGSVLTLLVPLATVAYTAFEAVKIAQLPPTVTTGSVTGEGSTRMDLVCRSPSGCWANVRYLVRQHSVSAQCTCAVWRCKKGDLRAGSRNCNPPSCWPPTATNVCQGNGGTGYPTDSPPTGGSGKFSGSSRAGSSRAGGGKLPTGKKITQTVAVPGTVAAYKGDVRLVYEAGYAVTIGIWDTAGKKIKAGNSVSSQAVAARRSGVKITFVATVSQNLQAAATSKSQGLTADASALVAGFTEANKDLGKAVPVPKKKDIVAEAPVVTTAAVNSGSATDAGKVSSSRMSNEKQSKGASEKAKWKSSQVRGAGSGSASSGARSSSDSAEQLAKSSRAGASSSAWGSSGLTSSSAEQLAKWKSSRAGGGRRLLSDDGSDSADVQGTSKKCAGVTGSCCMKLDYGDTLVVSGCYDPVPVDGVTVWWDMSTALKFKTATDSTTDPFYATYPRQISRGAFGVSVRSESYDTDGESLRDMEIPLAPGWYSMAFTKTTSIHGDTVTSWSPTISSPTGFYESEEDATSEMSYTQLGECKSQLLPKIRSRTGTAKTIREAKFMYLRLNLPPTYTKIVYKEIANFEVLLGLAGGFNGLMWTVAGIMVTASLFIFGGNEGTQEEKSVLVNPAFDASNQQQTEVAMSGIEGSGAEGREDSLISKAIKAKANENPTIGLPPPHVPET